MPIDFSAPSLDAIKFAIPLTRRFGAELHLVYVEPDYAYSSMMAVPLTVSEVEVGKRIRRHIRDIAKKYALSLNPKNIHAPTGRPFERICQLARRIGADLIVIATRGNTGLKHLVLGSTAERVVRYSPCPVLVVRHPGRKKAIGAPFRKKKILVPVDFSKDSLQGLNYAKAMAKEFGSTLVLLHSVHFQYYVTSDEYARYDLPLLMRQTEEAARKQMRELERQTDWEGTKVETLIEAGHPGQQICDRAKDHGVDFIVTSTHGATGLKHVLVGSTAEFFVRHAYCPVLVVPSHDRPVVGSTGRK